MYTTATCIAWRFFYASIILAKYLHSALKAQLDQVTKWIAAHTALVIGLVACAMTFSFSALMHFHSVNVDVAFLQDHASKIEWLQPASYFNGFHPILLPILIKISGISQWPLVGLLLSNLAYGACLALIYRILKQQFKQPSLALLLTVVSGSLPQFFEVFVSPMQDSLLVLFILLSMASFQKGKLHVSGMWMGLSALTRGHGLFIALLFFLFFVWSQHRDVKTWRKWIIGMLLVYTPQLIVNWTASGNPFTSYQNFNIYQHFYLGQFPSSAELEIPKTLLGIIQIDSTYFFKKYTVLLTKNAPWFVLSFIGLVIGLLKKDKALISTGALVSCYMLVAILGNSSRLYAPILLFVASLSIGLVRSLPLQQKPVVWMAVAVVLGLLHFSWMDNASLLLKYRHSHRMTQQFSTALLSDRKDVTRRDVLNGHFEYTWNGIPGFAGRARLSNWYRYQNPEYHKAFPVPSLQSSAAEFHTTCLQLGIQYVVLRQGLLKSDAFENWAQHDGFSILESLPQKKFFISSHYEPLSKEIDTVHLIKVLP